jgi:site-specific recombinase
VLKTYLEQGMLPSMLTGALVSTTYATSFVSIQMLGFTLATKQPAMTAPAIAAKLAEISDEGDLQPLVEEIAALIQTQFAATFGNVIMVIPTVTFFHFLIVGLSGEAMLSAQQAREIVDKHSVFGPSPFFAAITGVILWASSLVAGYVDNWSAYRQVPEAIGSHRKLQMFFGVSRVKALQVFMTKHLTALSSNIVLGFLLGMLPKIFASFGLPLDVRHVTLATGLVSLSVLSLGVGSLSSFDWFLTLSGLLSIGLMNIGVSFAFALRVAIQARGVATVRRQEIYKALLSKATRRPLDFLIPRQGPVKPK